MRKLTGLGVGVAVSLGGGGVVGCTVGAVVGVGAGAVQALAINATKSNSESVPRIRLGVNMACSLLILFFAVTAIF
jgi:hypothetical protein